MLKICLWVALCCQIKPPTLLSAGRPGFGEHTRPLNRTWTALLPSQSFKTQTDGQRVKADMMSRRMMEGGRQIREKKGTDRKNVSAVVDFPSNAFT